MKTINLFVLFVALAFFTIANTELRAQNGPVMYFCERYGTAGEVNISDRFYTGPVTVMVKCDYPLGLRNCSIQFDRYTGSGFEYYIKIPFDVTPDMKYIYFESSDLRVDYPGIYRCFLLDEYNTTVTSALIEFIR